MLTANTLIRHSINISYDNLSCNTPITLVKTTRPEWYPALMVDRLYFQPNRGTAHATGFVAAEFPGWLVYCCTASGSRHQASGSRHHASCIRHHASGIRHQASGSRQQASCIMHHASSRHQASGLRWQDGQQIV